MGRIIRFSVFAAALVGAAQLLGQPALAAEHTIEVREFVLARGIEAREPAGTTEGFATTDGRAYAFARIANTGDPVTVIFVWRRGDKVHSVYTATIGASPGWRVWSHITPQAGPWRVVLATESGKIIAERNFSVD